MKLFELVTNGGPGAGSESVDIFHTTDSGQTWSKIASTENPASGLPRGGLKSGISFRDAMHGWATGGDYSDTPWFYMTSDGATPGRNNPCPITQVTMGLRLRKHNIKQHLRSSSAQPASYNYRPLVNSIRDHSPPFTASSCTSPMMAVRAGVGFWKTTPGTLTTFQTDLQGLYIADPQHAWAVSRDNGTMYGTTDGGQSWHQLTHVGHVTSMSFVNNQQGWLISEKSLLHTTNGGQTWPNMTYSCRR